MDISMLSRIQFALTVGFHFLFPPITIGLAWLLVAIEGLGWRRDSEVYRRAGRFFGKLLALTFAVGVATGIVMEFQFGTNWARYSKFVGDIFGAPLAAEGVLAFFLESTFLGVYLFGRNRISKGWHWFSILMVAVGSTLSAFWIIVANSWMQTPAGYTMNPVLHRAELTDFWAAVFNPSMLLRYCHTVMAAIVTGSFFLAGAAAYILLRAGKSSPAGGADAARRPSLAAASGGGSQGWPPPTTGLMGAGPNAAEMEPVRKAMKVSLAVGLVSAMLVMFPFGHMHAQKVAQTQPEKFAAIEGLYKSPNEAPLVIFALPKEEPPELKARIEIPNMLSWMAFGDPNAKIVGIDKFPPDEIPPLWLTFVSFHNMVILGIFFFVAMAYGVFRLRSGRIWQGRKFLWLLVVSVPLPLAACQFGWVTAEVGRQPWIVYKLMRTADAFSSNLTAGHILFSLILLGLIYAALLGLYMFLLFRKLNRAAVELGSGQNLVGSKK
jgi:cytochrome d ubiquinol oxidase subunit I